MVMKVGLRRSLVDLVEVEDIDKLGDARKDVGKDGLGEFEVEELWIR